MYDINSCYKMLYNVSSNLIKGPRLNASILDINRYIYYILPSLALLNPAAPWNHNPCRFRRFHSWPYPSLEQK